MPITKKETSFTYDIPIPDSITSSDKKKFLNQAGQYLVDSMLNSIADGISPVKGQGPFKKLSKHYADEEKGGDRTSNMDDHGSMLNALTYKIVGNKLEIGIFDKDQAIKSYNHNVGDTLPKRQFIPNEGQSLLSDIMKGIGDITNEYIPKDRKEIF
jgi:hypothetical protein